MVHERLPKTVHRETAGLRDTDGLISFAHTDLPASLLITCKLVRAECSPFIRATIDAGAIPSIDFNTCASIFDVDRSVRQFFELLEFLHALRIARLEAFERCDLIIDK